MPSPLPSSGEYYVWHCLRVIENAFIFLSTDNICTRIYSVNTYGSALLNSWLLGTEVKQAFPFSLNLLS